MSAPAIDVPVEAAPVSVPRWAERLLVREPGTPLALFRIGVGLSLLLSLGSVWLHGDVGILWLDPSHGGLSPTSPGWLFHLLGGADLTRIHLVLGATMACGACLVLGLGNRLPAVIALVGYPALVGLQVDAGGSYDSLMGNALWLLVLADSTATLSLDARLRKGSFITGARVPAWPRWLVLYQLVLMYLCTGLQKVSDTWVPGGSLSAIYFIMQQPTWQRGDMHWLAHIFPLTQAATLSVWLFEVGSPLLLLAILLERGQGRVARFLRFIPYRRAWAAFGLSLHLGIWLALEVGCFPILAMSFYAALWAPHDVERARG
ncbi:MAG: HTTM domain-containing protein [Deltaproteobacteria bacterium]|nr:HTTM domain-containing protein [Deltaproteobacteria bacterium]